MQKDYENGVYSISEVVLSMGYLLLNPTAKSTIANVSSEQTFFRNYLFYRKSKMTFKEICVANAITVKVQEALVQNELYDLRGYGQKAQYSMVYGTSFQWVDIPTTKVKYKWLNDRIYDFSSSLILSCSSSVYSLLKAHDFYLAELNQAIKQIGNFTLLAPALTENGDLVYQLLDAKADDRFKWNSLKDLRNLLCSKTAFSGILTKDKYSIPLTPQIVWNPAEYPNLLLAGAIGGGKTYACTSIMCEMSLRGYEIYVIDGKDADLAYFGNAFLPSGRTATTGKSALNLLKKYFLEMEDRTRKMKQLREQDPKGHMLDDFRAFNLRPKMLFIDEFASIITDLKADKDGKKLASEANSLLKRLILKNRQSGCFITISTQSPNAKTIDTDQRDNLLLRIFMGQPRDEVKRMVFGSGVELPKIDFVTKSKDGKSKKIAGLGFIQFAGQDEIKVYHSATLPSGDDLYHFVRFSLYKQSLMR